MVEKLILDVRATKLRNLRIIEKGMFTAELDVRHVCFLLPVAVP